jgi:hypothetical protein
MIKIAFPRIAQNANRGQFFMKKEGEKAINNLRQSAIILFKKICGETTWSMEQDCEASP